MKKKTFKKLVSQKTFSNKSYCNISFQLSINTCLISAEAICCILFFLVFETVSLCTLGQPGTHCVAQAYLNLILLPFYNKSGSHLSGVCVCVCTWCVCKMYIAALLHVCLCKGARFPGTEVTNSYKLPCRSWELNPDPLEEKKPCS